MEGFAWGINIMGHILGANFALLGPSSYLNIVFLQSAKYARISGKPPTDVVMWNCGPVTHQQTIERDCSANQFYQQAGGRHRVPHHRGL